MDAPQSDSNYVHSLRFYKNGIVLFGRAPKTNKSGLDFWKLGACLIPEQMYGGCSDFSVISGRYKAEDEKIKLALTLQSGYALYTGTCGYNTLHLVQEESHPGGSTFIGTDESYRFAKVGRLY